MTSFLQRMKEGKPVAVENTNPYPSWHVLDETGSPHFFEEMNSWDNHKGVSKEQEQYLSTKFEVFLFDFMTI